MKILITDKTENAVIQQLKDAGHEVTFNEMDPATLLKEIPHYDGLMVRSRTKATADVINAGAQGSLKVIGRAGIGVDNIDNFFFGKGRHRNGISQLALRLSVIRQSHFSGKSLRRRVGFGSNAELRLLSARWLYIIIPELNSVVAIGFNRFDLRNNTGAGLYDGHRQQPARFVIDLGHSNFFSQQHYH
jgi:hypothetical protein